MRSVIADLMIERSLDWDGELEIELIGADEGPFTYLNQEQRARLEALLVSIRKLEEAS